MRTIEFPAKTVLINQDERTVMKRYHMDPSINAELNERITRSTGQASLIDEILKDGRLDMLIMMAYTGSDPQVLRIMSAIQKISESKN